MASDFGEDVFQGIERFLSPLINRFMYMQRQKSQTEQARADQFDQMRQERQGQAEPRNQEMPDGYKLARYDEDTMLISFESQEARDDFVRVLDMEHVGRLLKGDTGLLAQQRDYHLIAESLILHDAEVLGDRGMELDVGEKMQRIRDVRQHGIENGYPVRTEPLEKVEERIKSHDGMDIDTHSGVVESSGYDYKDDIAKIVAEAKEGDISEDEFMDRCRERGLEIERAADGDYLYKLSPEVSGDGRFHQIKGGTLERKTVPGADGTFRDLYGGLSRRNTFSKGEEVADVMKENSIASAALSRDRGGLGMEREVTMAQQLVK